MEPLRIIKEQYGEAVEWQIVSAGGSQIQSSSGFSLGATAEPEDIESTDILIVLASKGLRQLSTPDNLRVVMTMVRQSDIVIGAEGGAWLLAATGLLDDHSAAIHWQMQSDFAEEFPNVHLESGAVVCDGRLWSCGAASSALDLMLDLVGERFGADKAVTVSSMLVQDASEPSDAYSPSLPLVSAGSNKLHEIIAIMAETLESPLSLNELCNRSYVSSRTLNRLFQSKLDMSPGRYYQTMRLARARELAERTDLAFYDIALRCGYANGSALSKAFKHM